jgi:hypothetical protein
LPMACIVFSKTNLLLSMHALEMSETFS